ncbi:MAG: membrane protein insertase YidC, partial [Bacteroidota bacterium]
MDRNSVTGIILMTLLTLGYFYFFPPTPPEPSQSGPTPTEQVDTNLPESQQATTPDAQPVLAGLDSTQADSVRQASLRDKYSDMWRLVEGTEEKVSIVTDKLTVELNTKGGTFDAVYLNEHKTFDSLPLPVLAPDPNNEFFFEFAYNNRAMRTDELFFVPSATSMTVNGEDVQTLTMRADVGEGKFIEQVYTFTGDQYDVGYSVRMQGLGEGLGKASYYDIRWKSFLPKTELSLKNMRQKTSVVYRIGKDIEKMSPTDDTEKDKLGALVKWVSFKSQFFSQIFISDQTFRSGSITMRTPDSEEINRVMEAKLVVDVKDQDNIENDFMMYFGPNEYTTLSSYDLELEEEMDLGWWLIGWINKGTTYIFKFMEKYISNYGLIIILLAVFIRLLMLPLSYKSYISMAKMRIINGTPEIKALDTKYKDDPQKLQMAKMAIYKEMGASMFGGCLPMLLSYPFL